MKTRSTASGAKPLFYPRVLEIFDQPYGRSALLADVMAGVTVGLIALPLALALGIASIPAGTQTPYPPPAVGLFTAIFAGLVISSLGGSRVQIGGPTAAFIPIVLLIIEKYDYSGLILATLMAGGILVVMGFARMGTLIKFIPWPVTSGFTTGIAVSIVATQAVDFLGIHAESPPPREFFHKLQWIWENLSHCHFPSLGLAFACVLLIAFWPRLGINRVPGSIVAMLAAAAAVALFGLEQKLGLETIGSKFGPGAIPLGLPPFQLPDISLERIRSLVEPAMTIALLGAIESLLSAVVADGLSDDRHDSNTELIAQGVANIVCPFFGGLPATGAIARTSANVNNGGRTPIAGIVHSLTLLLVVLVFARHAVFIPVAAMSSVLVMVAFRMGEWHEFRRLHLMPRSDAVVLLATFVLTVIFDLVVAVEVGMVLAAVLFIHRVSETTEVSLVTDEDALESPEQIAQGKKIPDGVLVYRIFGPFLFGAAEKMEDAMQRIGKLPRVLILRLHLVSAMDATALNALESIVERMQHAHGTVILSGLHRQPLDMLRKAGFVEVIGRKNFCATFDDALVRANQVLAGSG